MAIKLLTGSRLEKKKLFLEFYSKFKGKKSKPKNTQLEGDLLKATIGQYLHECGTKPKETQTMFQKMVTFSMAQNKAASPAHHAQANQRNRKGRKL